MSKKVFELAKELNIRPIDLVETLRKKGFAIRNHMQVLDDDEIKKIHNEFQETKENGEGKKKTSKKKTKKRAVKTTKKVVRKKEQTKTTRSGKIVEKDSPEKTQQEYTVKEDVVSKEKSTSTKQKTVIRKKKNMQGGGLRVVSRPTLESPSERDEKDLTSGSEKITSEAVHSPVRDETESRKDDLSKKGKKKRLSGLATMISKKKMISSSRSETLAQQRSENELKSYSSLSGIGMPLYTQIKRKKIYVGPTKNTELTEVKASKKLIKLHKGATAVDIAKKIKVKFKDLADRCLDLDLLVGPDDFLGMKLASSIGALYGYRVEDIAFDEDKALGKKKPSDQTQEELSPRHPIIAIMGHVDHGKTTLLDTIRKTKVAESESGGITQHIGAYQVEFEGRTLTFLDTPGHEAFTAMRQRGADVTDVVVLVVAADDGVMPQTKESIRFCQNSDKPIVVAINKMDKEQTNEQRVQAELSELGLTPEQWGGDTQYVPISALKGEGINQLLEAIALMADLIGPSSKIDGRTEGIIIETKIEQGRGPVATAIIKNGVLKKGDSIIAGESFGKARGLMSFLGEDLKEAPSSTPVQILGLGTIPSLGDTLYVVKNEREAKKIVQNRIEERKIGESGPIRPTVSLEDFFSTSVSTGEKKRELNLIIRSDVQGSFEAIKQSLESLSTQSVTIKILGGGIGPISDNDVQLAYNSKGFIVGFNMRPIHSARKLAENKGVEIKTYSIIYDLINDVKLAIEGLLDPECVEHYIGRADVKEIFTVPKIGVIAGTFVVDGKIVIGHNVRLLRNGQIVHDGKILSLRRFKDDVKEVKNHLECGIGLENFNDIKVGDTIECYMIEEKRQKYDDVVFKENLASKEKEKDSENESTPI